MRENSQSKRPRFSKIFGLNVSTGFKSLVKSTQRYIQFKGVPVSVRRVQLAALLLIFLGLYQFLGSRSVRPIHKNNSILVDKKTKKVDSLPVEKSRDIPNPFDKKLPSGLTRKLKDPWNQERIPVVQFYARAGKLPCKKEHYIYRNLQQARKFNKLVYFIGPEECRQMADELKITLDPYTSYQNVFDWFAAAIGKPIGYQVRWFVLRAFMEKHGFGRVFYTDSDVLLFADVTEAVRSFFPKDPLVLSIRWPNLDPPGGPSQYASTAVSGHVSLWTHDALVDFLKFFELFFKHAVLTGNPEPNLVTTKPYNDMVPLGWYTFAYCWLTPPKQMNKTCLSDKASGVTPERSARIRGKFKPKFKVSSFCEPKKCKSTSWSDEGWCAFDNNFSIQTPTQFFHFLPQTGMKCPTSMHYTYFSEWRPTEKQTEPVQFLAVHFQAHKKGYISRNDDPAVTWGSSVD